MGIRYTGVNMSNMALTEELQWRGFVNQTTYKDIDALNGDPITFYWGVDPSAPSMQIGNLAAAMMVRHFINHGHKAVLLIGGATGLIGDPDGKAEERDLKPVEEIDANKVAIATQYKRIFEGQDFKIVDNYDWFKDMGYLQFLREVGKHVPLRQMVGRDFVQSRLGEDGSGISYAEFSYSLIQGYDFLHLFKNEGVTLQVAASDQWGNSIAGVELIRRITGKEANVWTTPLIVNKATGVKFGKSEDGAVWLDENLTSVYKFYQFWLNVDDEGAADYLKIYTLLDRDEIEHILHDFNNDRASRLAQKTLAYEVTKLVHGEAKATSAKRVSEVLFGGGNYQNLSDEDFKLLETELPFAQSSNDVDLIEALANSGLASSNTEARRFMSEGAVYLNGQPISEKTTITRADTINGYAILRRGKNSMALLKLS